VANALRANPDINVIWALQDFEFLASIQTIKSQGLQPAAVYGYYPPPEALDALRNWKKGDPRLAVADSPIRFVPWYAIDALINKYYLGQKDWVTNVSIKELPVVLMTPENVPAGKVYPYEEFEPFFVQRWAAEGVTVTK
jgi:ABC-type sugar transport system substrate-binding protein